MINESQMKSSIKSLIYITVITGFVSLAATIPNQQKDEVPYKAKNLKILPKDMTYHQIDSVMDDYKAALGVKCDYCHVKSKENPKKLDFASDEKEYKLVAREMMKMTNKLNKKYFEDHAGNSSVGAIQCITCHRGKTVPEFELRPKKVLK